MQIDSTGSPGARRSADRSARVLAAIALTGAVLALLPVAFYGQRTDAAVASAPIAAAGGSDMAKQTERGAPSYFGFLEFDWDRGIPGFDPLPADGPRP